MVFGISQSGLPGGHSAFSKPPSHLIFPSHLASYSVAHFQSKHSITLHFSSILSLHLLSSPSQLDTNLPAFYHIPILLPLPKPKIHIAIPSGRLHVISAPARFPSRQPPLVYIGHQIKIFIHKDPLELISPSDRLVQEPINL